MTKTSLSTFGKRPLRQSQSSSKILDEIVRNRPRNLRKYKEATEDIIKLQVFIKTLRAEKNMNDEKIITLVREKFPLAYNTFIKSTERLPPVYRSFVVADNPTRFQTLLQEKLNDQNNIFKALTSDQDRYIAHRKNT